jgi:class 3 adenylate cyclase
MRLHRAGTTDAPPELRFDHESLRHVTVLAQELERVRSETLTAGEIEQIGSEAGLDVQAIRQALRTLAASRTRELLAASTRDRWMDLAARSLPVLWALLGFLLLQGTHLPLWTAFEALFGYGGDFLVPKTTAAAKEGLVLFVKTVSWLPGLLAGPLMNGRRRRFEAGALGAVGAGFGLLAGSLAVWTEHQLAVPLHLELGLVLALVLAAAPVSGLVALAAGEVRTVVGRWLTGGGKRGEVLVGSSIAIAEPGRETSLSRQQIIAQLLELRARLEAQEAPRTFLSVDVVGSTAMKQSENLAAEYSFDQFRRWVEEEIRARGGVVHSAAGDGLMCMFEDEAAALAAGSSLMLGLDGFNTSRSRLRAPFRIRCGLSSGRVPLEEGVPLAHLQSGVIDRAAKLQKSAPPGAIVVGPELAAAAQHAYGEAGDPVEGSDGARAFQLPP